MENKRKSNDLPTKEGLEQKHMGKDEPKYSGHKRSHTDHRDEKCNDLISKRTGLSFHTYTPLTIPSRGVQKLD